MALFEATQEAVQLKALMRELGKDARDVEQRQLMRDRIGHASGDPHPSTSVTNSCVRRSRTGQVLPEY